MNAIDDIIHSQYPQHLSVLLYSLSLNLSSSTISAAKPAHQKPPPNHAQRPHNARDRADQKVSWKMVTATTTTTIAVAAGTPVTVAARAGTNTNTVTVKNAYAATRQSITLLLRQLPLLPMRAVKANVV